MLTFSHAITTIQEVGIDKMVTRCILNMCRLCRAMGGAEKVEIEYGNHSLSNRVEEAVQAIIDFLKREGPKGWDDPWN